MDLTKAIKNNIGNIQSSDLEVTFCFLATKIANSSAANPKDRKIKNEERERKKKKESKSNKLKNQSFCGTSNNQVFFLVKHI